MKFIFLALIPVVLAACADTQPLLVKQFTMSDEDLRGVTDPMMAMEKKARLQGYITRAERNAQLGQYVTIIWHDFAVNSKDPVKLVYMYQQGKTAEKVRYFVKEYSPSTTGATAEFSIKGKEYLDKGRILSWKAMLYRGSKLVASRQSYLWQ